MGKQKEGSLQERIQKLIIKRGGYCFKNHGDMTTEPGIPDITCCYRGLFVGIEVKVDDNEPSKQQGIHCRKIWKADGIACVVWSVKETEKLLDIIDEIAIGNINKGYAQNELAYAGLDDGTGW